MKKNANLINASEQLLQTAERLLAPTYARPNLVFVDGDQATLFDTQGNEYLDMSSGIAVLALGHRSELVSQAIKQGADQLIHISNLYHSQQPIELAQQLTRASFAQRVFYCNSGAEAVEAAIKFARLAGGATRREVVRGSGYS